MDFDPAKILRPAPQPEEAGAIAPLSGSRSQSMQRLQIGLFGLAAMVLLVGLANIIIRNADRNQARVVPEAAPTVVPTKTATPASDPLAEAGVVPDMPVDQKEPTTPGDNLQPQESQAEAP